MATWKSKTYTFKLETYPPGNYGGDWADVNFRWEYQTTADSLCVLVKYPHEEKEQTEYFSQEHAVAQLITMMDWYMVYNSQEALDKLVADLKKEHNDYA